MPPENFNSSLELTEKLLVINKENEEEFEVQTVQELYLDDETYEVEKQYELTPCNIEEATLHIDVNATWDNNALFKLMGIDIAKMPDKYNVTYLKPMQKRKHKKKRINKKWAKKYGYIMKQITTKGWKIEIDGNSGTFKFTK